MGINEPGNENQKVWPILDFPCGPVGKTPSFYCKGQRFDL